MLNLLPLLLPAALAGSTVTQDQLAPTLRDQLRQAGKGAAVVAIGSEVARIVEREARSDGLTLEVATASPAGDRAAELGRVRRQAGAACLLVVSQAGTRSFLVDLQCDEAAASAAASPPADRADLTPFAFSKVIFRLDPGQRVGTGWVMRVEQSLLWGQDLTASSGSTEVRIIERLREAGLPVRGAENLLFDQDRSGEAPLVLGGEVREVAVSAAGGLTNRSNKLSLVVGWQVYDRRTGRVGETLEVRGYAESEALSGSLLDQAVLDSAARLADDRRFLAALAPAADSTERVAFEDVLSLPACPAGPRTLPADLATALAAVVPVQAGSRGGAGVLVSADGWLLTAAHVVEGSEEVLVTLSQGGPRLPAEVARVQPAADVALLRIPGSGYPCLDLGGEAPVGTPVYAAGAPVGQALGISVSQGIVSGLRQWQDGALLQTDASISPGHSGGPLIGPDGTVLGIISAKLVGAGIEGMAFAVPAATTLDALQAQVVE